MEKGKVILLALPFAISMGLVIYGQQTVGYGYLAMEIVGLCGILFVVYCYNRQYK